MKEIDREVIRTSQNGRPIYTYNPTEEVEDSERLNEGVRIDQWMKGITFDTARKAAEQRPEILRERQGYRTFTPCCRCVSCVILRYMENGELRNRAYVCKSMKAMVEKFGTCSYATNAKCGPLAITLDPLVEEAKERKMELVN